MVAKKIVVTESVEEEAAARVAPEANESDTAPEPSLESPNYVSEASPPPPTPAENIASSGSSPWQVRKPRVLPRLISPLGSLLRGIKRRRWTVALVGLAVIVGIAVGHVLTKPASNPLPKSLQQEAKFPVYYPHSSVGKYKYVADSGNYVGGKLTYNLGAGAPVIRITEQALTVKAPDLHKLQGFSVFQTPAGQAAVGASGNVLNGILITDKTLIILNGLSGVNRQDFTRTISSLGS